MTAHIVEPMASLVVAAEFKFSGPLQIVQSANDSECYWSAA